MFYRAFEGSGVFGAWPGWAVYGLAMLSIAVCLLLMVLTLVLVFSLAERKVSGFMQSRYGPMYVGRYHGLLQPVADMIKFLLKEDIAPTNVDKPLWRTAPAVIFTGAFLGFVVLPFGPGFVGAKLDVGLFYAFATSSIVVVGIIMAGWGSNNKWALYGAMRGAAQVISYEIPLAIAVLPVIMSVGSLNFGTITEAQSGWVWQWHVFNPILLVGFVIYFIASLAEVNRIPFDLPESESELVAGYHTEYTGMKFALVMLGEYADMFVVASIGVAVFLGGWNSGIPALDAIVPGPAIFVFKALVMVFVIMWLRWTLPRLRVDQLMNLCWKFLLPAALCMLLLYGLLRVVF